MHTFTRASLMGSGTGGDADRLGGRSQYGTNMVAAHSVITDGSLIMTPGRASGQEAAQPALGSSTIFAGPRRATHGLCSGERDAQVGRDAQRTSANGPEVKGGRASSSQVGRDAQRVSAKGPEASSDRASSSEFGRDAQATPEAGVLRRRIWDGSSRSSAQLIHVKMQAAAESKMRAAEAKAQLASLQAEQDEEAVRAARMDAAGRYVPFVGSRSGGGSPRSPQPQSVAMRELHRQLATAEAEIEQLKTVQAKRAASRASSGSSSSKCSSSSQTGGDGGGEVIAPDEGGSGGGSSSSSSHGYGGRGMGGLGRGGFGRRRSGEAGFDDGDDAEGGGEYGGHEGGALRPKVLPSFTQPEIAAVYTTLEPKLVDAWLIQMAAAVANKNPAAAEIMDMNEIQYEHAMHDPEMVAADAWLASNMSSALDRKSAHVRVLLATLGRDLRCGWKVLNAVVRGPADMDYRAQREMVLQFTEASFFATGVKEIETQVAAMEFLQMFYMQPAKYHEREEQLVEALMEKMPSALKVWKEKVRTSWMSRSSRVTGRGRGRSSCSCWP